MIFCKSGLRSTCITRHSHLWTVGLCWSCFTVCMPLPMAINSIEWSRRWRNPPQHYFYTVSVQCLQNENLGDNWHTLFQSRCPSCHQPTVSKKTQSTQNHPSAASSFDHCWVIRSLPLCWFSNTSIQLKPTNPSNNKYLCLHNTKISETTRRHWKYQQQKRI